MNTSDNFTGLGFSGRKRPEERETAPEASPIPLDPVIAPDGPISPSRAAFARAVDRAVVAAEAQVREASKHVRLWREVDALGGTRDGGGDWGVGYAEALEQVLAILERRGFTEHADPLDRLAAIEAQAEVLIVARRDLMVAVDQSTARLRKWRAIDPDGVASVADDAADLLDRLAAYMKGQDERLVAMGDQADGFLRRAEAFEQDCDTIRAERDEARNAATHLRDALADVRAILAGIFPPATQAIDTALTAIPKPRCRVVTSPRFYGRAELAKANDVIREQFVDRNLATAADVLALIEGIAGALGMRRAGA